MNNRIGGNGGHCSIGWLAGLIPPSSLVAGARSNPRSQSASVSISDSPPQLAYDDFLHPCSHNPSRALFPGYSLAHLAVLSTSSLDESYPAVAESVISTHRSCDPRISSQSATITNRRKVAHEHILGLQVTSSLLIGLYGPRYLLQRLRSTRHAQKHTFSPGDLTSSRL